MKPDELSPFCPHGIDLSTVESCPRCDVEAPAEHVTHSCPTCANVHLPPTVEAQHV